MKFYQGDLEIAHNGVETFDEVKKGSRNCRSCPKNILMKMSY